MSLAAAWLSIQPSPCTPMETLKSSRAPLVLRFCSSPSMRSCGKTTSTLSFCVGAMNPLADASTATGLPEVALRPVMAKLAVDCPAGIVTLAGTASFDASLADKLTTSASVPLSGVPFETRVTPSSSTGVFSPLPTVTQVFENSSTCALTAIAEVVTLVMPTALACTL